jgi:hypothetical protein
MTDLMTLTQALTLLISFGLLFLGLIFWAVYEDYRIRHEASRNSRFLRRNGKSKRQAR